MKFTLLNAFLAAVACSLVLTKCVRDAAKRRGWASGRKLRHHLHTGSIPRLGGIAIFLTVIGVVSIGSLVWARLTLAEKFPLGIALGILGPAGLIFLTGLCDDIWSMGPSVKFVAQSIAALLLYLDGFGIHQFDLLGGHNLRSALALSLTILWVLLITNAFNLIDGLDGLAAGSALFSTMVIFVLSLVSADRTVSLLAAVLAGAILGFLRFNFNPATIFLGDSGSLFIGFMLSALALAGSQKAPTMIAVAIPVVSFGLPILDVGIAVVRRFLRGRPLFRPDGEHIHHKLLKRGLSQRDAVLILYGVSALFGLLSLGLLHGGALIALILVVAGVGVSFGIQQLEYHEFSEIRRVFQRTLSQKRVIENDLNIRQATESLRSCSDTSALCRVLTDTLQPLGFDGFRFRLPFAVRKPLSPPLTRDPEGGFGCRWAPAHALETAWELKLKLVTTSGDKCGFFFVRRRSTDKPLLLDINLLSDGFHEALADAVRRTMMEARSHEEGSEPLETSLKARATSAASSD